MDELTRAKRRALYLLGDMDRTEAELTAKLSKNYGPKVVKEAVEYVKGFGYIDDERYTRNYLRTHLKHRSLRRVLFDLEKKGVGRDQIDTVLNEIGEVDQSDVIRELARKKLRTLHGDERSNKEKTMAYLARQGFHYDDIKNVLNSLETGDFA